jgi:hypothetical protein
MYINKLKDLSRNNIKFLLDNLEYKLKNQQNLYYDRDIDTIVLSDPNFTFKYKCNCSSIENNKIILEMPSYSGDPIEIYNKINKNTNHFTSMLYELCELMIDKAGDLGL